MNAVEVLNGYLSNFSILESQMQMWLTAGRAIGLIGAYIYIFKRFASKMLSGSAFSVDDIAYPVFIAFVLSMYSPIAKGIPELFGGSVFGANIGNVGSPLADYAKLTSDLTNKKIANEKEKKSLEKPLSEKTVNAGTAFTQRDNSPTGFQDAQLTESSVQASDLLLDPDKFISNVVFTVLSWILMLIAQIAMVILLLISKMYIIFLYIFGPISIGISLIPSFESSISNWFQNLIKYSLWVPIANTIAILTITAFKAYGEANGAESYASIVLVISSVLMIVCFLCVPKIAGNIISVTAGQSSTKAMASQAARMMITKGI